MTADPKVSPRPWIWGGVRYDQTNGCWYLSAEDQESNDEVGGLYSGPVGRRMSDPSEGAVLSPYGWECEGIKASALDRAHIVRCVNAHDGLVEALEEARCTVRMVHREFNSDRFTDRYGDGEIATRRLALIDAALAAAKEGA